MVHRNPAGVTTAAAPAGICLRTYQPGDERAWADIVNATDMGGAYDVSSTKSSLTQTTRFDPQGLFFACDAASGRALATACAYWTYSFGRRRATLHMVAALPEAAGKGLGALVCQAVLNYFAQHGQREVILTSDDHRLPAIVTYLRLGFEPMRFHRGEDHQARWQAVHEKLGAKAGGTLRFAGRGEPVRIGILGLRRGMHLTPHWRSHPAAQIVQGCDWAEPARQKFLSQHPNATATAEYQDLLAGPADALFLANWLPEHASASVQAMQAGKDVLCEVTGFYCPSEGVELVEAVERTGRQYMLAENGLYGASVLEMGYVNVVENKLGAMRYAEGDYVSDWRASMFKDGQPTWRAHMPPLIYSTHPLGPLLRHGDVRPLRVVGMHTGSAMADTAGGIDMGSMLVQCSDGAVLRIACGLALNRQPPSSWLCLYGTKGSFETDRWDDRVHVYDPQRSGACGPVSYRPDGRDGRPMDEGHVQADARLGEYWIESLANGLAMPINVYEAADMTLPGLLGHRSSLKGAQPIDVPDFRDPAQRDLWRNDRRIP